MATVTDVTDATFETEVLKADKPTLVDFWASWCGPCRMLSPIIEQLATEYGDKINFTKIDADANPQVTSSQSVLGLPTVKVFSGGQVVKQFTGARSKGAVKKMLDEIVG
ncbi:thioredoxin 1 [Propionibacterium cyclohexanicum]|uniref:Thioredoxin n=1 Tax=Propionibacterium cyclohexanicum TaxID=64702 RepID=A0A1H9TTS3_9ACTN|nr:thioredoxin [Propionibacterium cyclohexanicum]SES00143.1 thioredoxin 1 [Propionibacterium cyclohexanicum]